MTAPTINDVARAAGVSKRTVSRVINNAPGTKPETRRRVLAVIRQMDYVPNVLAQRLARGETGIIGVFAYEQRFPLERENFFYPFLEGTELKARELGYDLLLCTQGVTTENRSIFDKQRNRTQIADGLVLMGSRINKADLVRLHQGQVPFVCIGKRTVEGVSISYVDPQYRQAYYDVTKSLIELGHRSLGFLGRPEYEPDQDKLAGYRQAVGEAGRLPYECLCPDLYDEQQMADFFVKNEVTAIISIYSQAETALWAELTRRGIRIPEDISIVTFDGSGTEYRGLELSRIAMPKRRMGELAVHLLYEKLKAGELDDDRIARIARVSCEFLRGSSVAAPRR